jgi:hypothetical protein
MSTQHATEALPLPLPGFLERREDDEIYLVAHRVTLENVCFYYHEGYSAEMLRERFPTLPLVLIHKVIVFYLENRDAVEAYLAAQEAARDREFTRWQQTTRTTPDLAELRRRRDARQKAQQGQSE